MVKAEHLVANYFEKPKIFVGKDVLEILSSSVYVNPLSVFREYIQNATDAIDKAVETGLLPSVDEGMIKINLDHINRRVIVRDNGCGLSNNEFIAGMLTFGASEKKGTNARGFRGVGRLSSLGYVQQLIFRSRANGDKKVIEARWDGHVIKKILASNDNNADLNSTIQKAVIFKDLNPEVYPPHFFEVELIKPRRIANDKLLNEYEIEAFISQVCPCPFAPAFSFGEEINRTLAPYGRAGKLYNIHINEKEKPVYRPYQDHIEYSDMRKACLHGLKSFEIEGLDGNIAAVGWLIHHDYQGAIPSTLGVRGLRARIGNIQIGNDRLFLEIFPEERFCSWTIGEVHILDRRIVPNSRRDEFEINVHLENIIAHLRPLGSEIARKCRGSSQKRNRIKLFNLAAGKVKEKLDILTQGAVSDHHTKSLNTEIDTHILEMHQSLEFELFNVEDHRLLKSQLSCLEKKVEDYITKTKGDVFDSFPTCKRDIYKEVIDLIYDCSTNKVVAKNLVDRIIFNLGRK